MMIDNWVSQHSNVNTYAGISYILGDTELIDNFEAYWLMHSMCRAFIMCARAMVVVKKWGCGLNSRTTSIFQTFLGTLNW